MNTNHEMFKELLKENGLKVTSQRLAILDVLQKRPDTHLTAEEIYECVREEYPEIGLATVYRTILLLSDLHLIDKLNLDDGYVRYEIGKKQGGMGSHHHHHLICLSCSKVLSFEGDMLDSLENKIKEAMGFETLDHEVKLYGYCKDCQKNRVSH